MIGPPPPPHRGSMHLPRPGPELLARVLAGDRGARRELFEAWAPIVLRWCGSLGGPHVDAEDAAHDVLVTAMTRLPTLQHPERFDAWMFGITRRVLARHHRAGWVRRWIPGLLGEVPDTREGPGAACERSELAGRVRLVLAELPADLREVLVLCDVEERPDEAVAALLDLPAGTVKSRLRRARARFEVLARRHALTTETLARAGGAR